MITLTTASPRTDLSDDWQRSSLALVYAALSTYFLLIHRDAIWYGVSSFLVVVCAASWWVQVRGLPAFAPEERYSGKVLAFLGRLPALYLALALPMMTSWFAGQLALQQDPRPEYWHALYMWLLAMGLFVALVLPWRSLANGRNLRTIVASTPWLEVGIVAALTLVALVVRVIDLVDEPSPFSGDEANFGLQAIEVLNGTRENMFSTGVPFGQPSIYYFLIAGVYKITGTGIFGTRILSVFFGVTMVPLLYLLLREQFDKRVAVMGAAFLAVYHFHIHFSRTGLNNMSAAWITVLSFLFVARATRTQKPLDFALVGVIAGLSLYSFVAARAVPLVIAVYFGWVVLFNWRFLRDNIGNFLLLTAGFLIVAAPQGLFFIEFPDDWYSGHRWANIFGNGYYEQQVDLGGRSPVPFMLEQFRDAFAVLVTDAEVYHHYNPRVPLIDAFSRWFFVIGGLICIYRIRKPQYFLHLSMVIVTVIFGAAVVTPPPSAARLVPLIPAVAAIVAIGLVGTADLVVRWRPTWAVAMPGLGLAAIVLFAILNISFYYRDYLPGNRYVIEDNKVTFAVGEYMSDLGPDYAGYWFGLPRIYTRDPTMVFVGKHPQLIEVPEFASFLPPHLTGEPDLTFMFLPERLDEAATIEEACPDGRWVVFRDHNEVILFEAYQVQGGATCVEEQVAVVTEGPEQTSDVLTEQDLQRLEDMETIGAALETYRELEGSYPSTNGNIQTLCVYADFDAGCALRSVLDPVPTDPRDNPVADGYFYASDGTSYSIFSRFDGPTEEITDACLFYDKSVFYQTPIRHCVTKTP